MTSGATTADAATRTVNLANPGTSLSQPGRQVDAVIDYDRTTITVVHRGWQTPSRVTARWINLRTGRTGTTGLPGLRLGPSPDKSDRFAVLPTGPGPVLLTVSGEVASTTGLLFGSSFLTGGNRLPPNATVLNV